MRISYRSLQLAILSLLVSTGSVANEPPRIAAIRVAQGPVIDGVLDDEVWRHAQVIDDFTQVEPHQGDAPSQRTDIRILIDRETLYFGISCFERRPDQIIARRMERDDRFFLEDSITITLDTFHDRRNGFLIQTGPRGGRRDGSFENRNFEENWDGIWSAKAQITSEGWFAEIAIPFKTLPFKPGGDLWGLNISRI
ncbi:MAG: carbohydrate binding family 9 domain-containing protein, partial [Myxococcota bacterium]